MRTAYDNASQIIPAISSLFELPTGLLTAALVESSLTLFTALSELFPQSDSSQLVAKCA